MANKFNIGDRVALKSGSPVMTVKRHAEAHTAHGLTAIIDKYECVWSDGNNRQQAIFIEGVLKLISAAGKHGIAG
ncbi:MAG TPA: DUF2158 domain-containing protein [Panacibacter sp.]|nr:DUF2158 domain-containing protein [Panacibacter sp.]